MPGSFVVACVQTNSARDIEPNIAATLPLVREARRAGAELILLPENVGMIEPNLRLRLEKALPEADHPALAAFRQAARDTGAWILIGSLAVRASQGKAANSSILVDPQGKIAARYDKIHLFDVDLGPSESYRESTTVEPGARAVVAALPWGKLGMSVCYDVRFPHLYRALAQRGADFLAIPAAFTRTTGRVHWHILVQARAIENGCYVFAPAQCGDHAEGRQTYGHSLIVDPWGEVLADGGDRVGVILARVDPARVSEARRKIPSLRHDRTFA